MAGARWMAPVRALGLGVLLLSGSGCISYIHSVSAPPAQLLEPCQGVPRSARDHVYIFFVHGMDPMNLANLTGVRDYVQMLGFQKTYYGQLYHVYRFKKDIRRIHDEDPEAHFVLVGFSFGANMVRDLALSAGEAGITIDLLVYCGGNTLQNSDHDQPENVLRIINVLAKGAIWNGAKMDRADNIDVPDVLHFGSPTHPRTLEALAANLAQVAAEVPVPPTNDKPFAGLDQAPTPRPVMPRAEARSPDWQFLRPVSRLRMPRPLEQPPDKKPLPDPERIAQR
jgi:hypothetical protein